MTRIVFVRHAQSAPDPNLPERDWPLSALGHSQAQALAPVLAELGVNALASSPYLRAVETLRPFAEVAGLPIHVDDDLRERNLGGWISDPAEVDAAVKQMHADLSFSLEGGESGHACLERFHAAVGRVARAHPEARLAIGSHGGVLSHLLAQHHDDLEGEFWRRIRNPHLFIFDYPGELRWVAERTLDGSAGVKAV
ncbi:MAG: histidine phosphatase family protein [Caulobacterales bacterium]